jgi:hypothetical protein
MVRCIRSEGPCPDSLVNRFDCNDDRLFDLRDVLCCARVILRGPHAPGDGRHDTSIHLTFGMPVEHGSQFEIPLRLESGTPLGGSRIALQFPSDRFEVINVESQGGAAWLDLYEVDGDRLALGLVALAGARAPVDLTLRLQLKAGQVAGGSVTLSDAQFSDESGETLIAELGQPTVPLGAGAFDLSAGTPNPFRTSLSFSVTLPRESDLEIGVFDLSGRRVTTLHKGTAAAGTHEFQWNGRDANGGQARGGVYFVRARAAGQLISRKAVFLGGR